MSAHIDDDLISLAGGSEINTPTSPGSPAAASKMHASRCSPVKRDSFSDLTVLMKAKKPYTPIPPPTQRVPLSITANGMQFASHVGSGSSILSPLARPYRTDGSVAAYLQEQACSPTLTATSPPLEYSQQDMQRLESMLKELKEIQIDDEEDSSTNVEPSFEDRKIQSLLANVDLLITLPVGVGPIAPPTPAKSAEPQTPEDRIDCMSTSTWIAESSSLEILKAEKRALEVKVARLEKSKAFLPPIDDKEEELNAGIGYLKYPNEQTKIQKASMARTLSQKDVEIKQLQLELDTARQGLGTVESATLAYTDVVRERDYIQGQLRQYKADNAHFTNLDNAKDREIQALKRQLYELQEAHAQSNDAQDNERKALAANRLEAVHRCEKQLKSVNAKYAAEHDKANQLEDLVQDLQGKLAQVGDLQAELRQKNSDCARWRTKSKNQEKMVDTYQQQIERARNENRALRGAAHLVKPTSTSKLSPLVLGCAECYAKNITCDNKALCRHCSESNEQCVRWRCSLKHILGKCPRLPCSFPHEEDGWLLATEPRPEW